MSIHVIFVILFEKVACESKFTKFGGIRRNIYCNCIVGCTRIGKTERGTNLSSNLAFFPFEFPSEIASCLVKNRN